jgi:hypothetical protein
MLSYRIEPLGINQIEHENYVFLRGPNIPVLAKAQQMRALNERLIYALSREGRKESLELIKEILRVTMGIQEDLRDEAIVKKAPKGYNKKKK